MLIERLYPVEKKTANCKTAKKMVDFWALGLRGDVVAVDANALEIVDILQ